jgi:hypothetical protein
MRKEIIHRWTRIPARFTIRTVRFGGFPLLILFLLVAWSVRPQASKPAGAPAATPLPTQVVYWQLFRHVNYLEGQAESAAQRGQDGSALRNFYQVSAGLTTSEATLLKQTASATATDVQAVDSQIQAVVSQFRAQLPRIDPSGKTAMPSPPPQLRTLQAQKDSAILARVSSLQAGFGATRFQQFDTYVQTSFAPHVTMTTATMVGQLGTKDPSKSPPLPPFPPAQ